MGKNDLKMIFKKESLDIPIKIQNLLTKLNILLQFINLYSKNLDFSQKLKQKTQGFDKLKNAVWRKQVEFLSLL